MITIIAWALCVLVFLKVAELHALHQADNGIRQIRIVIGLGWVAAGLIALALFAVST